MPLKKQIMLVVAVVAGLLLLSLLGSFYLLTRIDDGVRQREANGVPHEAALNFRYHVAQMQQFATDAAATGEKDALKEADAHFALGNRQLDAISAALPAEKPRLDRIRSLLKEFHDAGETMAQAYIGGGREAGNRIMKAPATGFDARADALVKEFEPLLTQLAASSAMLKEALLTANARGRLLLLVTNALVLVVVLATMLAGAVRILKLLGGEPAEAVAATRRIAGGDLATPIPGNPTAGSLLDAMRQMQAGLVTTVRDVVNDAEQVARAASRLTGVADELSQSSVKQADAAGSMAAYVEEMSASMEQVAANARTVHANALHSGELSGKGEVDVQKTIEDMRQIAEAVHGSENRIQALDEHSKQIAAIVNVIRGIAEQTNLLALNAAIEAARAGEQGRGFAVVADEVRKLAERTSVSTQEIAEMIDKIQAGTREAVSSMENGVSVVGRGVEVATHAGASMAAVRGEATGVARLVGDMSEAIKEQTAATSEFARNVDGIAAMAEANSRAAHQGAAAAQELQHLADSLRTRISRFRV